MDRAANGPKRTATMKGHIDKVVETGISEIVMFCNGIEIEDGELPEYLLSKNIGWWADTFYAVYTWAIAKTVKEITDKGSSPDYFARLVERCERLPNHRGYVLDDVWKITPEQFEAVVSALRQHSSKPIIASFGAIQDLTDYLPTIIKHKVKVGRQLYRHELAKEKVPENRTKVVTTWLTAEGYLCDVSHLEYFKEGTVITSAADLMDMYHRCLAAGQTMFMGYAAVDVGGFEVWEHPELWAALKLCAADFESRFSSAG